MLRKLEFSQQILGKKKTQIQDFVKIRPVGAEMFHADRQTERRDEAKSRFFAILRTSVKVASSDTAFSTNSGHSTVTLVT